ncbi:hypothetical protein [Caulobacter sp. LARHSG274]
MIRPCLGLAIFGLFAAAPALADEGRTTSSKVEPVFSDGTFRGCSVVFDVIRNDPEYSANAIVKVSGSITVMMSPKGDPLAVMKLGAKDAKKSATEQYSPPEEAYFINENGTNAKDLIGSGKVDAEGLRLFIYKISDESIKQIAQAKSTGKLKIGYALRKGGALAPVEVDFTARSVDAGGKVISDGGAPKEWDLCLTALMQS